MPDERYLDTNGLNEFWSQVKTYIDANGGADVAPGILLYASVAEPIQKNHSTTMTKSGFVGPLPKVNDAGYGLLTYDKKLYQVAYHVSSIDSDGLYTIVYDGDPLLIGPSEGGSSSQAFLVRAPIGTIVIWSGTTDNIPTGWQLCDGTNGTPDLRDKFVLGAGTSHAVGNSGGEEKVTLTIDQMPTHSHDGNYNAASSFSSNGAFATFGLNSNPSSKSTSLVSSGSSQPHNNMPPYYALCYIMKLTADPTDGVTQEELTTALADKQDTLVNGTGTTVLNNGVNINTPVQQIVTQAEFDALSEDDQNKGLWVISDGESGGSSSSSGGVPSGFIGMWSGTEIPTGWYLCNGENGTPDLRDRFILGAGTKYAVGGSGGSETITLTVDQMPSHNHSISGNDVGAYGGSIARNATAGLANIGTTVYTNSVGSSQPHNNMPPYYVLAFIMKA